MDLWSKEAVAEDIRRLIYEKLSEMEDRTRKPTGSERMQEGDINAGITARCL
jgi:hypothetical protein